MKELTLWLCIYRRLFAVLYRIHHVERSGELFNLLPAVDLSSSIFLPHKLKYDLFQGCVVSWTSNPKLGIKGAFEMSINTHLYCRSFYLPTKSNLKRIFLYCGQSEGGRERITIFSRLKKTVC